MPVSNKRLPDSLAGLSDLFFNYEHPNYDALMQRAGHLGGDGHTSEGEDREALIADAADFLLTFRLAVDGLAEAVVLSGAFDYPTAEQLAADFLARL